MESMLAHVSAGQTCAFKEAMFTSFVAYVTVAGGLPGVVTLLVTVLANATAPILVVADFTANIAATLFPIVSAFCGR